MNREILFRGKRLDNGEWVEGYYVVLGGKYHYILTGQLDITKGYLDLIKNPVDPKSVGQYIGRTDTSGRKIFEGDQLEVDRGDVGWLAMVLDIRDLPWALYGSSVKSVEVVGYVYENTEPGVK